MDGHALRGHRQGPVGGQADAAGDEDVPAGAYQGRGGRRVAGPGRGHEGVLRLSPERAAQQGNDCETRSLHDVGALSGGPGGNVAARLAVRGGRERQGLLKARRRANGYRDYPPEAVEWLGYIRTAQRLGFSLQEIAANLEDVERAADPDAYLQELLRDKLRVIEARIDELQALRGVLYSRLGEACPLRT